MPVAELADRAFTSQPDNAAFYPSLLLCIESYMRHYLRIGIMPDGGHLVETVTAQSGTDAAVQLREKLGLTIRQFEVVAVALGEIKFECVDAKMVALAPYSSAQPSEPNMT